MVRGCSHVCQVVKHQKAEGPYQADGRQVKWYSRTSAEKFPARWQAADEVDAFAFFIKVIVTDEDVCQADDRCQKNSGQGPAQHNVEICHNRSVPKELFAGFVVFVIEFVAGV